MGYYIKGALKFRTFQRPPADFLEHFVEVCIKAAGATKNSAGAQAQSMQCGLKPIAPISSAVVKEN